ncbi:MAG: hypothetical protein KJ609_19275 [Gammaproteobacteria bacterium]|nr:hypothetical protein [Gammaproteobacteria bacterium]MBU1468397.1 hypothetical protein [Gammaproteobacteria bacterium]MBU2025093.1 hypothetical protein [Gammaproteobacteria bacterium]MBU2240017.1 hypothetical protein [Gammaproteobacteria bacterium]MBU2320693.1 hypothetical protein [Gammaproteobacteria bacterium]
MKDIFEAIETRVKSPVFGYFVLSMLAVNWKPFFFLFFDDSSVTSRFSYFDLHSSYTTLLVYPALLAALYSIIYPWIQYTFIWISSKPAHLKNLQNINAEHKQLIEHQKLERLRNEKKKEDELEAIERAKRDQKIVEEITDEGTREKVQSEIKSIRQESKVMPNNLDITADQLNILEKFSDLDGAVWIDDLLEISPFGGVKTKYLVEELYSKNFIEIYNNYNNRTEYKLTTKGMQVVVEKGYAK